MSKQNQHTIDSQIIERYTDQPARMPAEVRTAIEDAWGGRPVQLYALVDLDAGMRLTDTWLASGPGSRINEAKIKPTDGVALLRIFMIGILGLFRRVTAWTWRARCV